MELFATTTATNWTAMFDQLSASKFAHGAYSMIPDYQPWNTLGAKPQMGWNSWNSFQCNISQDLIRNMTDKFKELKLHDSGYEYINLDDCWQSDQRNASGRIQPDMVNFKDGIKPLADYVHEQDLKFGLYSSAGSKTCAGRAGSLGYEMQDAQDYADWGVDYLKYDNCYNEGKNATTRYMDMGNALKATGREIFYSLCNWGNEDVTSWAYQTSNSWRTTQDISLGVNAWQSMKSNFIKNLGSAQMAGPGHWNDPDMLQVGTGLLSYIEEQTHFSLWAFSKAPLIIGADLRNIEDSSLSVLKNQDVIDINQDELGNQCQEVLSLRNGEVRAYSSRVITNGEAWIAVLWVNWDSKTSGQVTFDLIDAGIAEHSYDNCKVYDIFTHAATETTAGQFKTVGVMQAHQSIGKKFQCKPF